MPHLPALAALPPGFTLRRACMDDAATLSQVGARTFSETFGHLYPRADLDAFLAGAYCVDAQHRLLSAADCAVWLLERDGEAVGHAAAGIDRAPRAWERPSDHAPVWVELQIT